MKQLDFVILGEKEIITHLTDLGHPKDDVVDAITKLAPDAIQRVYERLLERVCAYTRYVLPCVVCCGLGLAKGTARSLCSRTNRLVTLPPGRIAPEPVA